MSQFVISTDSTCDLPKDYIAEHHLVIQPLFYNIDNEVYGGDTDLSPEDFYGRMRNGSAPTTMATNIDHLMSSFRSILSEGNDILHISFSSALSSSHSNAVCVADELRSEYPNAKIVVIDSLCASLGQGLFVHKALELKESGKSIDEIADWLLANRLHFCHQFTVEDLHYLHRGGRVSKTAAVLGTLINVKPVLHVDNEGRLIPLCNVRGRKKSLITLVDNMAASLGDYKNDIVFISHADSLEDAKFVGNLVTERFGVQKILYSGVSPTIGSHSGPGTIALFYMGETR